MCAASRGLSATAELLVLFVGVLESELHASLGAIEEITGTLTVSDSFALTSLRFFSRLRLINGVRRQSNGDV